MDPLVAQTAPMTAAYTESGATHRFLRMMPLVYRASRSMPSIFTMTGSTPCLLTAA